MFAPHMEQAGCDTGSKKATGAPSSKHVLAFCLIVALPHCWMHAAHPGEVLFRATALRSEPANQALLWSTWWPVSSSKSQRAAPPAGSGSICRESSS